MNTQNKTAGETAQVVSKGGNQYLVTIGEDTKNVDLDGMTVMSDEDYNKVEEAGLIQEDTMISPQHWNLAEEDYFFKAALEYAANYSGFQADEYIAENK